MEINERLETNDGGEEGDVEKPDVIKEAVQRLRQIIPPLPELVITPEMLKSRVQCLIFFHYENNKDLPGAEGERPYQVNISNIRALGYPTGYKIQQAISRIRKTCPEEIKEYVQARREFAEARRRALATEDDLAYDKYRFGNDEKSGRNSVAFYSKLARSKNGLDRRFTTQLRFKYRLKNLLPREQEYARAMGEMKVALNKMALIRDKIFAKMGVPVQLRKML